MAALKQGDSDSYHIWRSGSQLLLLHMDETEQKAADAKILCGLQVLKGTIVPSRCGSNFLMGTAFPLVSPEFKWTILKQLQHSGLDICISLRLT